MRCCAGVAAALAAGLLGCTPEVPEGAPPGEEPRPRTRLDGVLAGGGGVLTGTFQADRVGGDWTLGEAQGTFAGTPDGCPALP